MEKIHKLLKSQNKDDNEVGLLLLVHSPIEEILEIFRGLTTDRQSEKVGYIDIDTDNRNVKGYIEINSEYVIMVHCGLRLRRRSSTGFNRSEIIISKENFINGVY